MDDRGKCHVIWVKVKTWVASMWLPAGNKSHNRLGLGDKLKMIQLGPQSRLSLGE
jgi:hypothetical protein